MKCITDKHAHEEFLNVR